MTIIRIKICPKTINEKPKNEKPNKKVKLIINKKDKPVKQNHHFEDLPDILDIETYTYNNNDYFIDTKTKYLFHIKDINNNNVTPIGRLIEKKPNREPSLNFYPLKNRVIVWY